MKISVPTLKKQIQRGFTLVEIAIVLVIIGLLIGGILRGQELINTARVRSLVAQQTSIQTAYYGFLDRYKLIPGNLNTTQAALVGPNAAAATTSGYISGTIPLYDSPVFFNNITNAGFISCSQCATLSISGTVQTVSNPANTSANLAASTNSPTNIFGSPLAFTVQPTTAGSTSDSGSVLFLATSTSELAKPMVVTGSNIPSNMLAEMDRKMDDGVPSTGAFRYTGVGAVAAGVAGASTTTTTCIGVATVSSTTPGNWQVNPVANCQGASQI